MNDTEYIIKIVNNLVLQAVIHGADSGGSYNNNKEKLESALNDIIECFNLTRCKIEWDDEWGNPVIVQEWFYNRKEKMF